MSTRSIPSILAYPQYGYHLVYHTGLSLVHCSYLSIESLHPARNDRKLAPSVRINVPYMLTQLLQVSASPRSVQL